MIQNAKPTLVIFDLVSTLTDAGPRYAKAFRQVCEDNGVTPPSDADVLALLGNKNLSEITDTFAGAMDPEKKKEFMNSCNNACDTILYQPDWHETLFPHVREAVEALHAAGVTLGIFTGTREDAMENQLAYHGIAEDFDKKYRRGKDNERDAKKTSDILKTEQMQSIVEQFKKDTGQNDVTVIVVGDSSADARAAENLGLIFAGFAVNDTKKEHLEQAGVKILIQDFSELPGLVSRLAQPAAAPQKPLSRKGFPHP